MPGLAKALKPVAAAYTNIAGYRQMGLKYDDLIIEEREDVQKVLVASRSIGPGECERVGQSKIEGRNLCFVMSQK